MIDGVPPDDVPSTTPEEGRETVEAKSPGAEILPVDPPSRVIRDAIRSFRGPLERLASESGVPVGVLNGLLFDDGGLSLVDLDRIAATLGIVVGCRRTKRGEERGTRQEVR
jgi:hypothetical protein